MWEMKKCRVCVSVGRRAVRSPVSKCSVEGSLSRVLMKGGCNRKATVKEARSRKARAASHSLTEWFLEDGWFLSIVHSPVSFIVHHFRQTSGEDFDVYLQNVKAQSEAFRSSSESSRIQCFLSLEKKTFWFITDQVFFFFHQDSHLTLM